MVCPLRNYSRIGACKGKKEKTDSGTSGCPEFPRQPAFPQFHVAVSHSVTAKGKPATLGRAFQLPQKPNPPPISRGFRNIPRYVLVFQDSSRGGDAA
jgi:hypothetical protein